MGQNNYNHENAEFVAPLKLLTSEICTYTIIVAYSIAQSLLNILIIMSSCNCFLENCMKWFVHVVYG